MRDFISLKAVLFVGILALAVLLYFSYFLPLNNALGDTPPFSMWNDGPLNTTTTRYKSSFFYGTLVDGTGTIDDDLIIYDSVQIRNIDVSRDITLRMSGKINGQEGWFAFAENSVVVPADSSVDLDFSITIPDGVCTNLYNAYLIANLEDYDGMDLSGGMNVSASIASEVFFNIDSGVPCLGGEVLPGLGDSPSYVPNPTFNGTVPVYTSGGGGGGSSVEMICNDGIDNDGDGLIDCDDSTNCAGNSYCLPESICDDGIDNDGDGDIDCDDNDCVDDDACGLDPVTLVELNCSNGLDDDGDLDIDCDDSDCVDDPVCLSESICDDGIDNDSDGDIDCDDSDCFDDPVCLVSYIELNCENGIDDDFDGDIDCEDIDCIDDPVCVLGEDCNNGLDDDGDGDIDCADSECSDYVLCQSELICNDGLDNDGDSYIDCADIDCEDDPYCQSELICDDGIDNDVDTYIDCDDSDCFENEACEVFDLFNVKALPEKRVEKSGGNFSTLGRIDFYGIGGDDYSLEVPILDDGFGSVQNTDVLPGWYKTSFKGLSHLTKYLDSNVQIKEGVDIDLDFSFADTFYLLAGDVALSKDDFVNSMDISATVLVLYESDQHADLNLDGIVNALDLSIEFFNLYKAGDVLREQL